MKKTTRGNFFISSILNPELKKNKSNSFKSGPVFDIIQTPNMLEAQKAGLNHYDYLRDHRGFAYTSANDEHYVNPYKWDLTQVAESRAILGDPDGGAQDLEEVLSGMHTNGFIPNVRFVNGRYLDPERKTFKDDSESSYTQPPLEAQASLAIYESYLRTGRGEKGQEFLQRVFGKLKKSYQYFEKFRENGNGSELIGIIHPHETGRDSGPEYDYIKRLRLPTIGATTPRLVAYVNTAIDYGQALALNFKEKAANWNVSRIRKNGIFWANDVMFNAMYVKNLYDMGKISNILGKDEDQQTFNAKAKTVEGEIKDRMWDGNMFYSLNQDGEQIKKITVGNLNAIMLPDISKDQVKSILNCLSDPEMFATRYPIPSVPVKSREYDPHFREKRLWRGPTWINMDAHIVEGLIHHAERFERSDPEFSFDLRARALYIVRQVVEMVDKNKFWEFYDPETGEGYRITPFAWSGMAKSMEYSHQDYLNEEYRDTFDSHDQDWKNQMAKEKRKQKEMRKGITYRILARI